MERLRSLYERHFRRLSDRYYKEKPWPDPHKVGEVIDDGLFTTLYRELFYRHIFIKLRKPVQQDRHSAFENYIGLFTYILGELFVKRARSASTYHNNPSALTFSCSSSPHPSPFSRDPTSLPLCVQILSNPFLWSCPINGSGTLLTSLCTRCVRVSGGGFPVFVCLAVVFVFVCVFNWQRL